MLKIIHPVCCGVDVHKKFIVATIAFSGKNNVTTYKAKRFSTFINDLLLFKEWLSANNCNEGGELSPLNRIGLNNEK